MARSAVENFVAATAPDGELVIPDRGIALMHLAEPSERFSCTWLGLSERFATENLRPA